MQALDARTAEIAALKARVATLEALVQALLDAAQRPPAAGARKQ